MSRRSLHFWLVAAGASSRPKPGPGHRLRANSQLSRGWRSALFSPPETTRQSLLLDRAAALWDSRLLDTAPKAWYGTLSTCAAKIRITALSCCAGSAAGPGRPGAARSFTILRIDLSG